MMRAKMEVPSNGVPWTGVSVALRWGSARNRRRRPCADAIEPITPPSTRARASRASQTPPASCSPVPPTWGLGASPPPPPPPEPLVSRRVHVGSGSEQHQLRRESRLRCWRVAMEGMDPVTGWGSIDWSLEFWGKTLYPARDAHLVLLHHKGEDGRRFFFFGCRLLQKMSGRCGPVNGRNSAAMCYLQATHMPYAPGLCPSCRSRWPSAPPRRSTGPQGRPSPGARAARAFWASHVAHLPLPLPIARTPAVWTVLPHTALPRTAAPEARDDGLFRAGQWPLGNQRPRGAVR